MLFYQINFCGMMVFEVLSINYVSVRDAWHRRGALHLKAAYAQTGVSYSLN